MKNINLLLPFFFIFFGIQSLFAQENFKKQGSEFTYIFKISSDQALSLYENSPTQLDKAFFEQLIDSFRRYETYQKQLPVGHYVKTNAQKNVQRTYYQYVADFETFVFNNSKDLIIQVYDKDGGIIKNAEILVENKEILFDEKQKAYFKKNANSKGMLTVKHENFTAYYYLERTKNSSFLSRSSKNLAYKYPTKYIWLPMEYVAMLPIDAVKSIKYSYATGKIRTSKFLLIKWFEQFTCWSGIDDYHCESDSDDYEVAYFVFNKPKFKPNDTLKGKAFIWDRKGKALDEVLTLKLYKNNRNAIEVGKIKPSPNGSYSYKLHLHDSLELSLDKSYSLRLEDKDGNKVARKHFSFEDYELKGIRLDMQVSANEQFNGEELEVTLHAKDENDLRIVDGNMEILLLTEKSDFQAEDYVFVPDTLWTHQPDLSSSKPTKFTIPSTIFPKANVEYRLLAKLRTSDQEYIQASEQIKYQFESEKFEHHVLGDSILVEFLQNGKKIASDFSIEAIDHFGNSTEIYKETTPFQFQINALQKAYLFKTNDVEKEIDLNSISTGINARMLRGKDSVFIKVNNPNRLVFHYHIFKENKEIKRGFGSELDFSAAEKHVKDYYLTLNYVWSGKVLERNFVMPINDKNLSLKVNQPKLIYPGQEVEVELEVLNNKKQPVENADVLAYGMTSKFDYTPNRIKNYSTKPKNRKLRNYFKINEIPNQVFEEHLNIERWDTLADLKKLNYYKLVHPAKEIFKQEYELENQPTQFAPFVVDEGDILPVHIIYVNKKPIYFSDMTNVQPYSFSVDHRKVQVQLRTKNHLITLDSIAFKVAHKTIFSLDVNHNYPDVSIEKKLSKLEEYERNRLSTYVMPYRVMTNEFAYIQNKERLHLMQTTSVSYSSHSYLGPIHNQELRFVQNKQYELSFNLESNYRYEFGPKHLVQRPFSKSSYPTFLNHQAIPSFYDLALTENRIKALGELSLAKTKQNFKLFDYPNRTSRGNGTLRIEKDKTPSTIFLVNLKDKEDYRIYKGSQSRFANLKPSTYRLIFIYDNEDYNIKEGIEIKPDGTTYLKINNLDILKRDSFSDAISAAINEIILGKQMSKQGATEQQRELKEVYDKYETFLGDHFLFEGTVIDFSGLPLPSVSISVSGTDYGTTSDFDGNFQLRVPKESNQVEIQYIGCESQKIAIHTDVYQQIILMPDFVSLSEVVITGYSSNKMRNEAAVYSEMANFTENQDDVGYLPNSLLIQLLQGTLVISAETIENRPNSSFIQTLQGQAAGLNITTSNGQPGGSDFVRIRGVSSISGLSKPLIIINGAPYDGDFSSISADLIQNITVLKDAAATAIYGSRGANGVLLINTTQSDLQTDEEGTDLLPDFAVESSEANSIRTNFNDEAFWKPSLTTNKEGKVNFSITYPDDVTSWDTHFFMATESQQTGQTTRNVKSYRPLVAQLRIPRFLIEGDSVFGIGKVKNYLKDTISIQTQFAINEEIQFSKDKEIFDFGADKLSIHAKSLDSLQISYQVIRKDNNYLDGEQLRIPVFPKGMEKAEGEFIRLQQNDTLLLNFNTDLSEVQLQINANFQLILQEELDIVINYLHDCNEQIASRLKAQLLKRKIYQQQERTFEDDKEIKKLIRLLQKNQKSNQLWGWWRNSSVNLWASLNVMEALLMADDQEFKVKFDMEAMTQKVTDRLFLEDHVSVRLQLLQLLDVLKSDINYLQEIEELLEVESLSVVEKFKLWELYQKHGGEVPILDLMPYQKETALGNWYFEAEEKHIFHPYKNSVQATLIAYRILSKMDLENEDLSKIRDYLIIQRNKDGYANTFESMQVIETLLDEVTEAVDSKIKYQIQINNGAWQNYNVLTASQVLQASDQVRITHTSQFPLYVNYVQTYFDPEPEKRDDLFEVETHFENEFGETIQSNEIKTGNPVSLQIELNVKKQADYFMIEVPIPSGTSYHEKKQFPNETHREYAKDKVYIYVEALDVGTYTYTIKLMPRYKGSYQLNPAKAKLMYFEQFYGNNEMNRLEVVETGDGSE